MKGVSAGAGFWSVYWSDEDVLFICQASVVGGNSAKLLVLAWKFDILPQARVVSPLSPPLIL